MPHSPCSTCGLPRCCAAACRQRYDATTYLPYCLYTVPCRVTAPRLCRSDNAISLRLAIPTQQRANGTHARDCARADHSSLAARVFAPRLITTYPYAMTPRLHQPATHRNNTRHAASLLLWPMLSAPLTSPSTLAILSPSAYHYSSPCWRPAAPNACSSIPLLPAARIAAYDGLLCR